jgi:hypothetical protein
MHWINDVANSVTFRSMALDIGMIMMIAGTLMLAAISVVITIAVFPARFDIHLQPIAKWTKDNSQHKLQLIIGLGSRRRLRWFFGLMLFDSNPEADFVPRSRILEKKHT